MIPEPAAGCCPALTVSGGQAARHPPVQVDMLVPSPVCLYRVIPLGPVRNVPSEAELAVPTVTGPVAVEIDELAAAPVVGDRGRGARRDEQAGGDDEGGDLSDCGHLDLQGRGRHGLGADTLGTCWHRVRFRGPIDEPRVNLD